MSPSMPRFSAQFWPFSQGHRPCLQRPCVLDKVNDGWAGGRTGPSCPSFEDRTSGQVADSWTEGDGACNLQTRTGCPIVLGTVALLVRVHLQILRASGWSRRSRTTCPAWLSSSFKHHSRRQTATSQARIRLSSRFRHLVLQETCLRSASLSHDVAEATSQEVPRFS